MYPLRMIRPCPRVWGEDDPAQWEHGGASEMIQPAASSPPKMSLPARTTAESARLCCKATQPAFLPFALRRALATPIDIKSLPRMLTVRKVEKSARRSRVQVTAQTPVTQDIR